MTRGGRRNKEMTYNDENCDDDRDALNPVDRWLASRKRRAEILEQAQC